MNVLALDCSGEVLCAACARGIEPGGAAGGPARAKHPFDAPGTRPVPARGAFAAFEADAGARHAERAVGAIEVVLRELGLEPADLDLLAFAAGPGSFTGLRIAAATIKGMGVALGKPWVGVPTLDAYAADWAGASPVVVPVLDARRGRLYAAVYESGVRTSPWLDADAAAIAAALDRHPEALLVGPDAELLEGLASERSGIRVAASSRRPPARALVELAAARFASSGPAGRDEGPIYVRPSDAEERGAAEEAP